MNREDITRMAQEAGFVGMDGDHGALRRFATLVASAERERIKQANAPEIERINAHIKELEDAVLTEREACAEIGDSMDACQDGAIGRAIRARGQA